MGSESVSLSESDSDSERTNEGHSSSESLFSSGEQSSDVRDVGGVGDLSLDSGVLCELLLSGVAGDA